MGAQQHQSDPGILDRRTLHRDHRVLAACLRPGMRVLDVGCGTGAITAGIAQAVGPAGSVIGIDRDAGLIEIARVQHCAIGNLSFSEADVTMLGFERYFDIVTAARVLQWIANPEEAVQAMARAAKPGGLLVVLDYNHAHNAWEPDPPAKFRDFYRAFLQWREANDWDNEMADHLPGLFRAAGIEGVESHIEDEVTTRGDEDFDDRAHLWTGVVNNVGWRIAAGNFCSAAALRRARTDYERWVHSTMQRQVLSMRTVAGRVAAGL